MWTKSPDFDFMQLCNEDQISFLDSVFDVILRKRMLYRNTNAYFGTQNMQQFLVICIEPCLQILLIKSVTNNIKAVTLKYLKILLDFLMHFPPPDSLSFEPSFLRSASLTFMKGGENIK